MLIQNLHVTSFIFVKNIQMRTTQSKLYHDLLSHKSRQTSTEILRLTACYMRVQQGVSQCAFK